MAISTPQEYKEMEFRALMAEMVRLLRPKVYVEIGVKKAYTFNMMMQIIPLCYGIDINWRCEQYITKHPEWPGLKEGIFFIEGTSSTFKKEICIKVKEGKEFIDFLFIDGDHKKESVLKDFYNLIPYVKRHTGIVFMHDTYPVKEELLSGGYCSNAWEAAREIKENFPNEYELFTIPGPWAGLSMIRKLGDNSTDYCYGWMDMKEEEK